MRIFSLLTISFLISLAACGSRADMPESLDRAAPADNRQQSDTLFTEGFEDDNFAARGWYDGPQIETTDEVVKSGNRSCVWHWEKDGVLPGGKGGRVKIEPTSSVTFSYWIKHSENWQWTGRGYHPHEFLFMTTEDPPSLGPAYSHLTLYVEAIDGKPAMGMQDSQNIDTTRIGEDLTGITEQRSVAGGNGDPDGHGGDYYRMGDVYRNGRHLEPDTEYFTDDPGPHYKADWHHVKARFVLNSIVDGKGVADGVVQYWQDGELIMDHHDVMFRTGQHPEMKINQFQMLPYIGPGAKADQKVWIDDIVITR